MPDVMTQVPADHPLMAAWTAYKSSLEFKNTRYWAQFPDNVEGSLWAAFVAGFMAGGGETAVRS